MAIKYSLSAGPVGVPTEKDQMEKRIYAHAQYNEQTDLRQLARHIQEHGSPFTHDVIVGVLSAAVDCLREQLVMGNKVDFGDLGSFYVSLHGQGVEKAEDFNPRTHITRVESKWEPSAYFADLKDDPNLKWEYTLTRKEMADAKKQAKQEATEAVGSAGNTGSDKPDGGNDSGNPGGGGNTPGLE